MFADKLYTLSSISPSDSGVIAGIVLYSDHALYAGHFPGQPIMPGVVQLQVIKEVLESYFGKKLIVKGMRTCKFLQIINPFEVRELVIEAKFKCTDLMEVVASISLGETVYLKAQITYA